MEPQPCPEPQPLLGEVEPMERRRGRAFEDGVATADLLSSCAWIWDALQYEFAGVQPADLEPTVAAMVARGTLQLLPGGR